MKLCFLWVDRFKNLANLSASFCSEYQYAFDSEKKQLTRFAKPPLPDSRLLEPHLSHISGVLGANGTGKTTLLELICLVTKAKDDLNSNYILIYESEGELFYYSSEDSNKNLISSFEIQHSHGASHLEQLNVIFFSNVYDDGFLNLGSPIKDISVNRQARYFGKEENDKSKFIQDLDFIKSDAFRYLRYPSPRRASVKIDPQFWSRYTNRDLNHDDNSVIRKLRDIYSIKRRARMSVKEHACVVIELGVLARIYADFYSDASVSHIFQKHLSDEVNFTPDLDLLMRKLIRGFENDHPSVANMLSLLRDIDDIFEMVNLKEERRYRNYQINFTIALKRNNLSAFEAIVALVHIIPRANMQWAELSSGQRAYVNLFSSVWNALADSRDTDALVCIDEGDLYLHPQLQVEFIEKLVRVMPHLTHKEMQIIVTTHSPLLVTDLPGQCLTVLTKDKNGLTQAKQGGKTFGANLYDIYRNTFQLDNQRTGNLSQDYMTRIIRLLDKEVLMDADIVDLTASLNIIGDKLLRYHIEKKLNAYQQQAGIMGGQYD